MRGGHWSETLRKIREQATWRRAFWTEAAGAKVVRQSIKVRGAPGPEVKEGERAVGMREERREGQSMYSWVAFVRTWLLC